MSSRCVTYQIVARTDGAVDINVTTTTGLTVARQNLVNFEEVHAALQDLRIILAALDIDLLQRGGVALA